MNRVEEGPAKFAPMNRSNCSNISQKIVLKNFISYYIVKNTF